MAEIRDAIAPGTRIVDDCWSDRHPQEDDPLRGTAQLPAGARRGQYRRWAPDRARRQVGITRPAGGVHQRRRQRHVVHPEPVERGPLRHPGDLHHLSNGAYRQVRMMKIKILGEGVKGRNLGTVLSPPDIDFCKIAEGMGIAARKVSDPGGLKAALEEALGSGIPNLVDVTVDASF